jgi:ABC-type antimicrobial peptide transport system permease subunit
MSETAFPINDLLRRKLSTGLTVTSLTTVVASTLFLLLFSSQIGLGIASTAQNTLTRGISLVFGQFLFFVGVLIFAVGAVIVSFIVYLMMAQRTKDFGLMKATGCPNSLVFGYFMTELLGTTLVGCVLGTLVGLGIDFLVINLPIFEAYGKAPNLLFAPLVFVAFFAFALLFGAKPILEAARMSPIKALSPLQYFGLGKGKVFKPLSRAGLTLRIASRSLFRRKAATVRIVIFLSVTFLLLTVSIAGGIIANDTSRSWLEKGMGINMILVAQIDMANQYTQLLGSFSGATYNVAFNYSDPAFALSPTVLQELQQINGVAVVDARLVWRGILQEVSGWRIDPGTLATITVGSNRKTTSLIVGLNPETLVTTPFTDGTFLNSTSDYYAVVGDSISRTIYAPYYMRGAYGNELHESDPLLEAAGILGNNFKIVGVCLDPLNNGNVTYVPLRPLQNLTGISSPNVALVKVNASADFNAVLNQMQTSLKKLDPALTAVSLKPVLEENTRFLSSLWAVVMFLPAFALAAASLCLVSYLMLSIDEQHQEFAILRATGAKPRTVLGILTAQSLTVLLSGFAVGISLGTITTLLILTTHPVVSSFTVVAISAWLLAALLGMFLISLYPAVKFARKPLLKIMS